MFRLTTLALLVVLSVLLAPARTGLTADPVDCKNFVYQEDAQAYFNSHPGDLGNLDGDHNGIACEMLPPRPVAAPQGSTPGSGTLLSSPQPTGTFYTAPTSSTSQMGCPASNLPECFSPPAPAFIAAPAVVQQGQSGVAPGAPPQPIKASANAAAVVAPAGSAPGSVAQVLGVVSIRPPSTGDAGLR